MASKKKNHKSRKRPDLAEYKMFSDSFILTPRKNDIKDYSNLLKLSTTPDRTYPVLKVSKSTQPTWMVKDSTLNLKNIPDDRFQPRFRAVVNREDTFDVDFSMPKEIREVLEEEGLEKKVINRAIGQSERKHKMMKKMFKDGSTMRHPEDQLPRLKVVLPPIISTQKQVPRSSVSSDSWLDLSRQKPRQLPRIPLWENPMVEPSSKDVVHDSIDTSPREDQESLDIREWTINKQVEEIYSEGGKFTSPRIILISSKVPKCHLLTQIYKDEVIPILYDFDSFTFTEILDAISKKLNAHRKYCKAKSIMVLCQGGPGYIYLLKHYAITPQKLHKPSYRCVVGFWRALACVISQLNPEEAAIHIFGFNLIENQQGKELLKILQSLMYPNLVKIEVINEETESGKSLLEKYFIYKRYQMWKSYQNSSESNVDISRDTPGPVKRHFRAPMMKVAR
ncbi:hypothetical protein ACF0H5_021680 [Mactra antiquata]